MTMGWHVYFGGTAQIGEYESFNQHMGHLNVRIVSLAITYECSTSVRFIRWLLLSQNVCGLVYLYLWDRACVRVC